MERAQPFDANGDYSAAQTNVALKAAPGAGKSLFITDVIVSNGAVAGVIKLINGSGGATKIGPLYLSANGGASIRFDRPVRLSANTALCVTSTSATTHSVTVCGYIASRYFEYEKK